MQSASGATFLTTAKLKDCEGHWENTEAKRMENK
jgi:hypothetical protein